MLEVVHDRLVQRQLREHDAVDPARPALLDEVEEESAHVCAANGPAGWSPQPRLVHPEELRVPWAGVSGRDEGTLRHVIREWDEEQPQLSVLAALVARAEEPVRQHLSPVRE